MSWSSSSNSKYNELQQKYNYLKKNYDDLQEKYKKSQSNELILINQLKDIKKKKYTAILNNILNLNKINTLEKYNNATKNINIKINELQNSNQKTQLSQMITMSKPTRQRLVDKKNQQKNLKKKPNLLNKVKKIFNPNKKQNGGKYMINPKTKRKILKSGSTALKLRKNNIL